MLEVAALRWNGEEWGDTEIEDLGFDVPASWNDHGNEATEVEVLWTNYPNHDLTNATLIQRCTGPLAPGPVG